MCGRGRHGDLIAVLFLDLDGFKDVNDRYGHEPATTCSSRSPPGCASCVRPGDVVARMGGDEFTILLTRLESAAPAVEVAERIGTMLARPFQLGANDMRISTSIGIAVATGRRRRPRRPAPARRRCDVSREVTRQGRLGDGPRLARARPTTGPGN